MIKIAVVDDHDLVRTGIYRLLDDIDGFEVVGALKSGEEAVELVKKEPVDVILMDIHMPGMGGLEATKKVCRIDSGLKVIAVTAMDDTAYASRFLQAGAKGFLTKGADPKEMETAIRKVHSGQKYLTPEVAQKLALKAFDEESSNPFDALSERELQITLLVVNGEKLQVISDQLCLSPKTVNTYRYRIFEKLNIQNDVELTRLAVRHGLINLEMSDKK